MKPYVLARAIEEDISIKSVWDGSSPQEFPKSRPGKPLKNAGPGLGDNSCPKCTLIQATARSLNTTFWALTEEVGANEVKKLAARAGITMIGDKKIDQVSVNEGIGIGQYSIPVIDQASGYATFAANGTYRPPYLVEKIETAKGVPLYSHKDQSREAFTEDVARDAGFAMQAVVKGTKFRLAGGRPAAGKTGTQQFQNTRDNSHVWMCGYTPKLAAAVWVGNKGKDAPLKFKDGANIGSVFTAKIWKNFMDAALKGTPEQELPDAVFKGDETKGNVEAPVEPSENPNPFPTAFPTLIPTERPDPPDDDPTEPPNFPTKPPFPTGRPSETKPPGFP
jgi:membrane peptidoglycan carboxypeptidase